MTRRIFGSRLELGDAFFHNLEKIRIDLNELGIEDKSNLKLEEQVGNFRVLTTRTENPNTKYNVSVFKGTGEAMAQKLQVQETYFKFEDAVTTHYRAINTLKYLQRIHD